MRRATGSPIGRRRPVSREPTGAVQGPLEIGDVVGDKYRVDGFLGAGSFAWVYRATHTNITSLKVAIKVQDYYGYFPIRHENGHNLDPKMTFKWLKKQM